MMDPAAHGFEDWSEEKQQLRHARYDMWGFQSVRREYVPALKEWAGIFGARAFTARDLSAEEKGTDEVQLAKVLTGWQVAMMGTGMILGAGIFVSTGPAAVVAGPAVIVSFMISGLSALLSALCFSEFAVRYPSAGGAYNYLLVSMGELMAWLVVTSLILQCVLANAAVARSLSSYACMLFNQPATCASIEWNGMRIDLVAGGLVAVLSVLLMFTTAGGSFFAIAVTAVQLAVVLIIIILGFTKADPGNLDPFVPMGWRSILDAAGFVFFSFVGFDCVSTLAEEVKNPAVDMPLGIVGSIVIVTVIYAFMSTSLLISVPWNEINPDAAFAAAMSQIGYPWAKQLVALGACMGIITGTLVGCMGAARMLAAVGGQHMVPPVLGQIHPHFNTPMISTAVLGILTLPLCIFSGLAALINLVSAGTLMVFALVALALLWHRYNDVVPGRNVYNLTIAGLLLAITGTGTAFGVYYVYDPTGWIGFPIIGGVHMALTGALMYFGKQNCKLTYSVPLFPFLPSFSILLNGFLMAALPASAYIQYLIFLAVCVVVYVVYCIQAQVTWDAHKDCPFCKEHHMRTPMVVAASPGSMLFRSGRIEQSLTLSTQLSMERPYSIARMQRSSSGIGGPGFARMSLGRMSLGRPSLGTGTGTLRPGGGLARTTSVDPNISRLVRTHSPNFEGLMSKDMGLQRGGGLPPRGPGSSLARTTSGGVTVGRLVRTTTTLDPALVRDVVEELEHECQNELVGQKAADIV